MRTRYLIASILLSISPAIALAASGDLTQITQDLSRSVWIKRQTHSAGVLMQVDPNVSYVAMPASRYGNGFQAPLCLGGDRATGPSWLGVAHAARVKDGGELKTYCFVNGPSPYTDVVSPAAALFKPPTDRAYGWIDWGTNRPPASTIGPAVVHTQDGGRKLYACYAEDTVGGKKIEVVGYVGDDQRCHGIALEKIIAGKISVGKGSHVRMVEGIKQVGARKGYDRYKLYAPQRNVGDKA